MKTKIKTFQTTYTNDLEGYSLDLVIEVWQHTIPAPKRLRESLTCYKVIMTNEGAGPLPTSSQSWEVLKTKREAIDYAIALFVAGSNIYD